MAGKGDWKWPLDRQPIVSGASAMAKYHEWNVTGRGLQCVTESMSAWVGQQPAPLVPPSCLGIRQQEQTSLVFSKIYLLKFQLFRVCFLQFTRFCGWELFGYCFAFLMLEQRWSKSFYNFNRMIVTLIALGFDIWMSSRVPRYFLRLHIGWFLLSILKNAQLWQTES